jgi:GAF domain
VAKPFEHPGRLRNTAGVSPEGSRLLRVTLGEFEHAAEALSRQTTVQGLLAATCRELVNLLDAGACAVSRVVGDLLVGLDEYARTPQRPLEFGHEYLISDFPLTREVVERREPRLVSLQDEEPEENEAALLERLGFDSLLMVCLPSAGSCWGLVEVYRIGNRFDDQSAALAEQVAELAGKRLEQLI